MEIRMTLIYVQWNDFPTDYLLDVYCPAIVLRRRPGTAFPIQTEIINIAVSRHVIPSSNTYRKYDNNPACYINM